MFNLAENKEQWKRLVYSLEKRDRSTLIFITFDHDDIKSDLSEKLLKHFPQYRFHDLYLSSQQVKSLSRAFNENLPESILNSDPAEYIVNVFGLEHSINFIEKNNKLEASPLISELNYEREILFRKYPFITIIWSDSSIVDKLKKEANDFWDWVSYHFDFKGNDKDRIEFVEDMQPVSRLKECPPEKMQRIQNLEAKLKNLENVSTERDVREKLNTVKLLAREYKELRDYENLIFYLQKALALSQNIQVSEYDKADILFQLGYAYFAIKDYDSAMKKYLAVLDIYEKIGNEKNGDLLFQMGIIYEKQGAWEHALTSFNIAIKIFEKDEDDDSLGKVYHQIGNIHESQRQWKDSLINYRKASTFYKKTGNDENDGEISERIATVLKKQKVTNPYNNKSMLPHDSDMFFGRRAELNRIENMLDSDNPQSVSIVGERRIGKSSIANRIYHRFKDSENTLAVFMDCDGLAEDCKTKEDFFGLLNEKFSEAVEAGQGVEIDLNLDKELFKDYPGFKSFVNKQAKKGIRFLIFIDEFEKLSAMGFADDSFFSNLRFLANKPDFRLAFVTVSQKRLKDLTHKSVISSGFWNIFGDVIIGLLEDDALIDLRVKGFQESGFVVEEQDFNIIDFYGGAFPFFNQIVCSHMFFAKASWEKLNVNQIKFELNYHYKDLWEKRTRDEQKVLKKLVDEEKADEYLLTELQVRGLLKQTGEYYYPFSKFFSYLIEKVFKEKPGVTPDDVINGLKKFQEGNGVAIKIFKDGKEFFSGEDKKKEDKK
ncbi:Tetratricopeptide repeat-containing protein [Desulfonema limicola]|uniref:Tetratricopeptide repeat-containing protein n=1 Tax=Desulfonema limicola TaxID=45656 RepID=A0A975BAW1_9BACT|nr:ATP-binding protein [Desulfonema limicola]QTA81978.1 Tetratricopeptide repeat-containing protein [Desulfonema limicola]